MASAAAPRNTPFHNYLYALLALGIGGFGLASQSIGVFVFGLGGVALNIWLVRTGRFRPLPRIVANSITILSLLLVARQVINSPSAPVLIIGQFLVVLQIVKLWEQRANRDYGQLLVLSLLMMVAASINTATLLFAIVLVAYLLLSLYCCLLFHLKVETDAARAAAALPVDDVDGVARDDQMLPRSMRRLTAVVTVVSLVMAVIVFLVFPRGSQGLITPVTGGYKAPLTGFSEEVNFDQVARITQNNDVVAYVKLFHMEQGSLQKVNGSQPLFLRGVTLDSYQSNGPRGQWVHGNRNGGALTVVSPEDPWMASAIPIGSPVPPAPEGSYVQQIELRPSGTRAIFSMAGVQRVTPSREIRLRVGNDGTIQAEDPVQTQFNYEVVSTGRVEGRWSDGGAGRPPQSTPRSPPTRDGRT